MITQSKPFNIDKRKVYEAYLQVRSNGGAASGSNMTFESRCIPVGCRLTVSNVTKNLIHQQESSGSKRSIRTTGVDGMTIEQFEADLKSKLYKIWNRMSSGAYFPPPVRAVSIPKKAGGERILGVPTVADRVAQTVVKQMIEPTPGAIFLADSYGYRPGKRGPDRAAAMTTLIMTAKLGDIDPLAWLADVLARIASIPQSRLPELLPWRWMTSNLQAAA